MSGEGLYFTLFDVGTKYCKFNQYYGNVHWQVLEKVLFYDIETALGKGLGTILNLPRLSGGHFFPDMTGS